MRAISGVDERVAIPASGSRFGSLAAWASTIAWIVLGLDSILRPVQDNRRDVFWWLPFGLLVASLVAVHRVQRSRALRIEPYAFWTVMLASGLVLLGNLGVIFNNSLMATMGFPGGALVFTDSCLLRSLHYTTAVLTVREYGRAS